ncbi:MAG: MerR family transcriptional regulator [Nakamurella sp.]
MTSSDSQQTTRVTIGEFARITHLTVIALRHYHEVGLLVPESIDSTGYRRYGLAQVEQAQLVRRLRQLEMPVPDVAAVLAAPDEHTRDAAIAEHLSRMEATLGRTAQVVASLRQLLQPVGSPLEVENRTVAASSVLGMRAEVARPAVGDWCGVTFEALYESIAVAGIDPAGPGGATYSVDFFERDLGEVLAFIPVAAVPAGAISALNGALNGQMLAQAPQIEVATLPAGRFAVAVHAGGYSDIDRSYGRLGSHVAVHDHPEPFPIREHYLVGPPQQNELDFRTEIWWPIRPARSPGLP